MTLTKTILVVIFLCFIYSTRMVAQLAGTYTVGTGGYYATLTAAFTDLNSFGVNGNVTFLLIDASYNVSSTLVIQIATNAPEPDKTVTIKPSAGVQTLVTGAILNNAIFKIVGTSYVTIDGSNTNGGTSRDLTIQNTASTGFSPNALVVQVASLNPAEISNITVKNCKLVNGVNGANNNSTAAFALSSNSNPSGVGGIFTDITLENNSITKSTTGIFAFGDTTGVVKGRNLTIRGNSLVPTTESDKLGLIGVFLQGIDGATIDNNDIGDFANASSAPGTAIWLAGIVKNCVVERNKIHDLLYTGTSGYGGKGICVTTGLLNSNNTIKNNMIYNMTGDGDSYINYAFYCPAGIYAGPPPGDSTAQSGVNIYFNTIYLYGNTLNYSAQAYSFGIVLDIRTDASVKNNIIVNNLGRKTSTGAGTVAIAALRASSQFTELNYNSYYCNATGSGANLIGKIGATDYSTLAAFQTATGKDANSVVNNVTFVSSSNLHLSGTSAEDPALKGISVSGITNDFDGDLRASLPFKGADEVAIVPITLGSFSARMNPIGRGVRLDWMTVSEVSNFGFHVQRRHGAGEFADVQNGFVPGHGTTIEPHHYALVDSSLTETGLYDYRLRQIDLDRTVHYTEHVSIDVTVTSVSDDIPLEFALLGNYPNPFNPTTSITYKVPKTSAVEIVVYNALGERITSLVSTVHEAGTYQVTWSGRNSNNLQVASGVYLYRMKTGSFTSTKKMLLAK